MFIVNNNMLQDWNIEIYSFPDILFYGLVWNSWEPLYPETLRIEIIYRSSSKGIFIPPPTSEPSSSSLSSPLPLYSSTNVSYWLFGLQVRGVSKLVQNKINSRPTCQYIVCSMSCVYIVLFVQHRLSNLCILE